ncbi:hypothetical protein [Streptomyces blastmyceticus]|uniref:Uncharacterized protein n=1 Tax=Streptomyces blastmyceticus TaxID=68180 RepID=A0ABN0W8N7_9ACTN
MCWALSDPARYPRGGGLPPQGLGQVLANGVPLVRAIARQGVVTEDVVHSNVNPTLVPRELRIVGKDERHEKSA